MKNNEFNTILKLNKIFKLGYIPSRKNESYEESHNETGCKLGVFINCFAHACFNLTNKQIQDFDENDANSFGYKIDYLGQPHHMIRKNLINFIKKTGLRVYRTTKDYPTAENQWIVAMYFGLNMKDHINQDYHFMLKEKDGFWSHKVGHNNVTKYVSDPPKRFIWQASQYEYTLDGFYLITNPFVESKKEDENENY